MRLGRKNLLYSMALAGIMLALLVGYFICMLPSLYVDYVRGQNLKSIRAQHEAYVEQGTYEGVAVKNSAACMSVEVPREGDFILVTGSAFSVELALTDGRLRALLDSFREKLFAAGEGDLKPGKNLDLEEELEELGEIFQEAMDAQTTLPVRLRWRYLQKMDGDFYNESAKIHTYSDGLFIVEASVEDSNNRYTNYIAIERTQKALVVSLLPVVSPEADEIRPVVLQSLPMLAAVLIFLVLLFSRAYSNGIVRPILRLARHAEEMRHAKDFSVKRLRQKGREDGDEISALGDALDDLYQQIKESYGQLEQKNRELAEENERQEVFLRASSHQLKTPVAAALLLVDGMMNEIGRYKDTKVYLPRVKEQLLSMRKMTEDILYLNRCARNMRLQPTDVGRMLGEQLGTYRIALWEGEITVDAPGELTLWVDTDEAMTSQILDNLLSNAVRYTPAGGRIEIALYEEERGSGIRIENFGARIPEELEAHIFEPFVSGGQGEGAGIHSHGLGLYIASYYAKKLGAWLEVRNARDSVKATLTFPRKKGESEVGKPCAPDEHGM